jgi:hypothetical protein
VIANSRPETRNVQLRSTAYAAEQGVSEEEALKRGMEEKSKEFVEKGG